MTAAPPTALWVSPVANLAGVSRHILDVARSGLPGWRLVVTAPEGPLLDELRRLGCPVVPLDLDQPLPRVVAALRETVARLSPDVVHSHLAKADFLTAMATVGLPTALVSTEHHIQADQRVFHGSQLKATSRVAAHRARLRRFRTLIAVSESTKRDMLRHWHPSAQVTVILNGVERPSERAERSPGLRFLSLTRLSPEKNLATTVRVFAEIRRERPEATLTIGGTGPEEATLRSLATELGVSDSVTFAGFVDAAEAMATHDVLLQPSMADNLSYTLLDAVAHGMGVAASDVGGNGEILPPRCLAPADDVTGLARIALEQALDLSARPTLPDSIPTPEQMAQQIVDVYPLAGVTTTADTGPGVEASVIVPCFRAAQDLPHQLDALSRQRDAPPFEVVISDNEGDPELRRITRDFADRLSVRVVDSSDRRGVSHARNVGALEARGSVIAFCDADDLVSPAWLAELTAAVRPGASFAAGGLRLDAVNPPHTIHTHVGVPESTPLPSPLVQTPIAYLGHLSFGFGANLAFGRQDYLDLGGCDESLTATDDVDLCWRAQEHGLELAYAPEALIDYRLRATPREILRQRRSYMRAQVRYGLRSARAGRPVRGTSWRWTLRETARVPGMLRATRDTDPAVAYRAGSDAGARLGHLEGLLRYRLLGRR